VSIERIIACGGGTRSTLWLQILADVAGVPIQLTAVDDAVALGSAICAAVGAGRYPDLNAAAHAMVHAASIVEPDPARREEYDRGYERYRSLHAALAPEFARPRN
jgi:ribulose kinase